MQLVVGPHVSSTTIKVLMEGTSVHLHQLSDAHTKKYKNLL